MQIEPGQQTEDLDVAERLWSALAAYAYETFCTHGRGVVVYEPRPDGDACIGYVSAAGLANTVPPASDALHEVVRTYNPARELVVAIRRDATQTTFRLPATDDRVAPFIVWNTSNRRQRQEKGEGYGYIIDHRSEEGPQGPGAMADEAERPHGAA